ncbi:MAG: arylsulfatase [Planctomycetota bacterium]|jgi:arylsulfatase
MTHSLLRLKALLASVGLISLLFACTEVSENQGPGTASAKPGSPADVTPRYVFLISLDTVAAQYCSVYGYEKPTTPFLEELGESSAVFNRHVVNSNNTLISHSSIMTGMLSEAHDTYDYGFKQRHRLAGEYVTLAERFQDAGFATAGFATHAQWLTKQFGIAQGFDHFESVWRAAIGNAKAFLKWFDERNPDRAFVFLHFFDAHSDKSKPGSEAYEASPKLVQQFAGARPEDYTGSATDREGNVFYGSKALTVLSAEHHIIPAEHLAYLRGTYDAGLAQLDTFLRRLFLELDKRGILDESLIVITSDHGEEFKQHTGMLHYQYYDEVMHVPLIIKLPNGKLPARSRVDELTRSIDLAPTILELSGLEQIPLAQGRSFASTLLNGDSIPYADILFQSGILQSKDEEGEFKFVWRNEHSRFYDLDSDPGETKNIYDSISPERQRQAKERLDELRAESQAIRAAISANRDNEPEMSAEDLEELQGLGYLGDDE